MSLHYYRERTKIDDFRYIDTCSKCGHERPGDEWLHEIPSNWGCPVTDPVPTMYGIFDKQRLRLFHFNAETMKAGPVIEDIPYTPEDYERIQTQYKDQLLNNCLTDLELF